MGYEVKKRKKLNGNLSWFLNYVDRTSAKRSYRHVKKEEYFGLGFKADMSLDEARAWSKKINHETWNKALEARKNAAKKRLDGDRQAVVIYLPEAFMKPFEQEVLTRRFRGVMDGHWRAAQKLITEVKLSAHEWCRQPEVVYNYFVGKQISPSYAQKIIRVLNLWGEYLFYKTDKPYFPIRMPTGRNRERIADAYFDSGKAEKESAPITLQDLATAKQRMKEESYHWLFISVWFGLRPMEVDKLKLGEGPAWYLTEQEGYTVFACYQWKLVSVPRDKRWKFIPLLFPEQTQAIELIRSGNFKRPLPKFIRKHLCKNANTYGGRKGFESLMRSKGRTFTEAQAWLGHASIETTWKSYRDQKKVFLEK